MSACLIAFWVAAAVVYASVGAVFGYGLAAQVDGDYTLSPLRWRKALLLPLGFLFWPVIVLAGLVLLLRAV